MNDNSVIPYMFGVKISQLTDSCKKKFQEEINKINEFVLINSDVEVLVDDIIKKSSLNLIEDISIDFDNPYYEEEDIKSTNNSTNYNICIPVDGNIEILAYKPCGRYLMCSDFKANISRKNNCLVTGLSLNNVDIVDEGFIEKAIDIKIQSIKSNILTQLSYLLPEIKQHNNEIKKTGIDYLNNLINAIKQKNNVKKYSKNSKYLRIVPKTTNPIEIVEQKIVTSNNQNLTKTDVVNSIRTISNESNISILETIKEYAIYAERLPRSYKNMDEEDIRDQILNVLNIKLKTATATGETFNVKGKTDIIIIDNKNICYIAECKIWNGQRKFDESITQLLGYISSDVVFSSIIIFNKKNIDIKTSIDERMMSNVNYKRKICDNRYLFVHPANDRMELEISVIVFNIHGNE